MLVANEHSGKNVMQSITVNYDDAKTYLRNYTQDGIEYLTDTDFWETLAPTGQVRRMEADPSTGAEQPEECQEDQATLKIFSCKTIIISFHSKIIKK